MVKVCSKINSSKQPDLTSIKSISHPQLHVLPSGSLFRQNHEPEQIETLSFTLCYHYGEFRETKVKKV